MGDAKSCAERGFEFPPVGPLPQTAAELAIRKPLRDQGIEITDEALAELLQVTEGHPYVRQHRGSFTWKVAQASPITLTDVQVASVEAVAAPDASFFRVRFDRLTPRKKRYLRAMAEMGPGPHRFGDIAACLGSKEITLAPTRSALIGKGMVWSPSHGDTASTVPMFDQFMKRIVPGAEWRTS